MIPFKIDAELRFEELNIKQAREKLERLIFLLKEINQTELIIKDELFCDLEMVKNHDSLRVRNFEKV